MSTVNSLIGQELLRALKRCLNTRTFNMSKIINYLSAFRYAISVTIYDDKVHMDMITISLENGKIMVIKLVYSYLIPIRVEPCLFSLFLEHLKIQLQIFANRVNRVLITLN